MGLSTFIPKIVTCKEYCCIHDFIIYIIIIPVKYFLLSSFSPDCPRCKNTAQARVCGSDGTTFHNYCWLQRKACIRSRNITVAYAGACVQNGQAPAGIHNIPQNQGETVIGTGEQDGDQEEEEEEELDEEEEEEQNQQQQQEQGNNQQYGGYNGNNPQLIGGNLVQPFAGTGEQVIGYGGEGQGEQSEQPEQPEPSEEPEPTEQPEQPAFGNNPNNNQQLGGGGNQGQQTGGETVIGYGGSEAEGSEQPEQSEGYVYNQAPGNQGQGGEQSEGPEQSEGAEQEAVEQEEGSEGPEGSEGGEGSEGAQQLGEPADLKNEPAKQEVVLGWPTYEPLPSSVGGGGEGGSEAGSEVPEAESDESDEEEEASVPEGGSEAPPSEGGSEAPPSEGGSEAPEAESEAPEGGSEAPEGGSEGSAPPAQQGVS